MKSLAIKDEKQLSKTLTEWPKPRNNSKEQFTKTVNYKLLKNIDKSTKMGNNSREKKILNNKVDFGSDLRIM